MDTNQIIAVEGLEGNDPTSYTPLQEAMIPFIPDIMLFWWVCWVTTLIFVVSRHILLPLFKKQY